MTTEAMAAEGMIAVDSSAKAAKKLKKKLRQIENLKSKVAAGGELEPNQLAKLETEATLRAELAALEV